MSSKKIVAVSPVHNRREITLQCLRSLYACDLRSISLEVIIVDDGSTDGTADAVAAEFPEVKVIAGDGNLWYTGGMNVGIAEAMTSAPDYILAMNNDAEFEPSFLQYLLDAAESIPRSVVGAVLVNWDDRRSIFQVAPKWGIRWGGMRHWVKQTIDSLPRRPFEVELIVGNALLIPAEAVREVGLMDAARLPQYGDAEYTPRMRKAGWRLLIEPRAHVYCKPNDIPERLSRIPVTRLLAKLSDPHNPHSLKRRINATVGSAPSRAAGYAAVAVFVVRKFLGMNVEGDWAQRQHERPLSEIYSDKTLGSR